MNLSELSTGSRAIIQTVDGAPHFCRRLEEMGFIRGKIVEVILNAPLKDPIKYRIMDYDVSLRRSEAQHIEVKPIEDTNETALHADNEELSAFTHADSADVNAADAAHRTINVALVGNPNCGKTSIFNIAARAHEHVGNYSGVTVESKEGRFILDGYTFRLYDLPGTYSLSAYSPEELFVRQHILEEQPDVVLNVVDASNLERNLFLTTQLLDMSVPMVMALNMYDDFERSGDTLDIEQFQRLLNVPMVPTVGRTGKGITALFRKVIETFEAERAGKLALPAMVKHGHFLEGHISRLTATLAAHQELCSQFNPRFIAIKLFENDKAVKAIVDKADANADILKVLGEASDVISAELHEAGESAITNAKYGFIQGALKEVYTQGKNADTSLITQLIDVVVTHRVWGFPIFLLLMYLTFYCTFNIGQYPMDAIDFLVARLADGVAAFMKDGPLKDLLVDGVIGGVGSVIVFLPNILILYLFISFMEDSGYMARAAFIMDRIMHRMGLHGKSFIPMLMGFGCNIPAIMATRTIEDRKSRLITILIIPLMSCSARLPIYMILVGAFFPDHAAPVMFSMYIIGVVMAVFMARIFSRFVVKGESSPFVMELPPYRIPTLKATLRHTWSKGEQYLRKMGTIILGASILIWFLGYYPNHEAYDSVAEQQEHSYIGQIGKAVEPLFSPCGFDWKQDVSIITGAAAKEIVASTMAVLYTSSEEAIDAEEVVNDGRLIRVLRNNMTPLRAYCFMLFVLLYMPCIPGVVAIYGETGRKRWAAFVIVYTTILAWLVTTCVYQIGSLF